MPAAEMLFAHERGERVDSNSKVGAQIKNKGIVRIGMNNSKCTALILLLLIPITRIA